jgi:D-alanyl-D-alanine-carboxypeptidase/D-alanyl-D-alanine-endopeptidase
MRSRLALLAPMLVAACGGSPQQAPVKHAADSDAHPHKAAVAALVQPLIDAEYAPGIVVGLYDAGKVEVYGFGKGPGNRAPDAYTLFEIGSVTRAFTSLLLTDAVQRKEVGLDTNLADLLPPGVTVPTRDQRTITLGELATHTSGLPRMPPSIAAKGNVADPFAKYGEDALYSDLVHTQLGVAPGAGIIVSNFGAGVLGFALGRKLGLGFGAALAARVLEPLGLGSTYLAVPAGAKVRRATGTSSELVPVPYWYFDALAGSGALISDAHDLLVLVNAELEASSGSSQTLRKAMSLSQEPQLDHPTGDNEGLGWNIDSAGRYWQSGQTGGFYAFVGFDPKTRRGVVVLASTALKLLDRISGDMYKVLAAEGTTPLEAPTPVQLQAYAGTYTLGDEKIVIELKGTRAYILGRGVPPYRLVPINEHEMWIEPLQGVLGFQRSGDKVVRVVFVVGDQQVYAMRVPDAPAPAPGPPPPPSPPTLSPTPPPKP